MQKPRTFQSTVRYLRENSFTLHFKLNAKIKQMKIFLITSLIVPLLCMYPYKDGDRVLGTWLTHDARAKIEIFKEGQKYHGKIVWLKEAKDANGNNRKDIENPDKSLRNRLLMGLKLVRDFVYEGGTWSNGRIYDPKTGSTYKCKMKFKGEKLEIRGYIGLPIFGKTIVWTRTDPVK